MNGKKRRAKRDEQTGSKKTNWMKKVGSDNPAYLHASWMQLYDNAQN